VRLLFNVDYVELGPEKALLQISPISFDASFLEIWGALLHGGQCVLFPENAITPELLADVIKRHRVTTLWMTASLFNITVDELGDGITESFASVRQLLVGGEALSASHVLACPGIASEHRAHQRIRSD
jgi:non-ribosomal peptide synthetase component F